ncbi:ATP-dependent DNA helicase [Trichonephila clavipes]|nr:ATP-dependent DNA helicase [Trichonephila clavipes]
MPPHIQHLKFCVPTIISQNINQPELCNGMLLAVQKLMSNIIEATILTGPFNDEDALIPRIPMIPTAEVWRKREGRLGSDYASLRLNTQAENQYGGGSASSLHGVFRLESDHRGVADRCVTRQ